MRLLSYRRLGYRRERALQSLPALRVKIPQVPRIEISAVLDIDPSAFEMSVDMFAEEVDLSTLDAGAAAEVQSFATDVSSSFAASVSSSLGVSADTVAVSCLYRNSDVTKLDLLTLEGSCGSSRKLKALFLRERRLQAQGFGVEIEVLGDDAVQTATESDGEDNGQSATEMLAAQIASTPVVIESNLLPEGVTVGADLGDISVEVQSCFDRGSVCVCATWPGTSFWRHPSHELGFECVSVHLCV